MIDKTLSSPIGPTQDVIQDWRPNDADFWDTTARALAWRTLWITTFCLLLSFSTWFMVSAIVVKLSGLGFKYSPQQLFWLTAMPGLAAGTLRIVHTFLVPLFGTRKTISVSTLLLAVPCIGWALAVGNPTTSFGTFMLLAFLAGLGGGNFSSFMPSTSLFFPKKKLGTALGIQAGIGNFGVSIAQFLIPAVIGLSLVGSSQTFVDPKKHTSTPIYLQNAAWIWLPFVLIGAVVAWFGLKNVPVQASFKEQLDIFKEKHTWLMTSLYIMTFGTFSGLSAAFPLLTKQLFGGFEHAPDPLKFAFLGPFVGAAVRSAFGPLADKVGGAKLTTVSAIGLLGCAIGITPFAHPHSMAEWTPFLTLMLGMFFFSGIGNASTFKQIPMIFQPRQASGVIGWTSAVAAYGPFIASVLLASVMGSGKDASAFFAGLATFYVLNLVLNWWFYSRRGAERPC